MAPEGREQGRGGFAVLHALGLGLVALSLGVAAWHAGRAPGGLLASEATLGLPFSALFVYAMLLALPPRRRYAAVTIPLAVVGILLALPLAVLLAAAAVALWAVLDVVRALPPPDRKRRVSRAAFWIERRTGIYLALPLVLLLMHLIATIRIDIPRPRDPIPMKILVEAIPPEPEPELPPPVPPQPEEPPEEEPPPPPPDAVATRPGSDEQGTEIVDPVKGETSSLADVVLNRPVLNAPPARIEDWVPNTDQAAELQVIRNQVAQKAEALEQAAKDIRSNLIRNEVQSAARDFILSSDGGMEGAIRLLNIEGFSNDIIQPILERYAITRETRFTQPTGGRGFLNAAVTESGTYRNVDKPGYYEVMVLSPKALNMMTTREIDALNAKGYDPKTSRVRKVVFGIVMNSRGEYDLGVTDLEVESIRPRAK